MKDRQLRIVIVGAGIAGLTLSAALWRRGMCSQVVEQASVLSEVGAGVQLSPNATRLLHRLGLADHLRSVAVRPEALEMRRWDDGRVLRRTELGERCAELYGAPYLSVHRADLHLGLFELVRHGNIHLGLRCAQARQDDDGVELRFVDGSTMTADVVIGADGIHSVVRDVLAADQPVYSGHGIFRGLVPTDALPTPPDEPTVGIWLGPGRHCVRYPVASGRLISFAATTPVKDWSTESWTAEGDVDDLVAQYEGWHPSVVSLLRTARVVGQWALHDRRPLVEPTAGHIAVIGDAAHPMLPFFAQGANQAIEDAAVLAGCLVQVSGPHDVPAALKRFAGIRADRVARVHGESRRNEGMLHLADGPEQRERDQILAGAADVTKSEWLYGYDADAAVSTPADQHRLKQEEA